MGRGREERVPRVYVGFVNARNARTPVAQCSVTIDGEWRHPIHTGHVRVAIGTPVRTSHQGERVGDQLGQRHLLHTLTLTCSACNN